MNLHLFPIIHAHASFAFDPLLPVHNLDNVAKCSIAYAEKPQNENIRKSDEKRNDRM